MTQVTCQINEIRLHVICQVVNRPHVVAISDLVLGILQDRLLCFLVLERLVSGEVEEPEKAESYQHAFLVVVVVAPEDRQLESVALMLKLQAHIRFLEFAKVFACFSVGDSDFCLLRELVLRPKPNPHS